MTQVMGWWVGQLKISAEVERCKTHPDPFELVGIDDDILKEKGFNDIWGVYLGHENYARQLHKNINNISGKMKFKSIWVYYNLYSLISKIFSIPSTLLENLMKY